jgi:outer membrane receptor protein involved in Fe transport
MSASLTRQLGATLRVTNLLDEDYAERADVGFGNYRYFVGRPRGVFLELRYGWDAS